MDDKTKKIVDLAYSASAESAFVMLVGKALQELEDLPGGAIHARNLLSALGDASAPEVLPQRERERLRTMQDLLISTVAHFQMSEPGEQMAKQ